MQGNNIVTIDKKEGILLSKNKSNGMFCLWLKVSNPKVNLPTLVNVHLVELLAKLNPDVIEKVEIIKSDNESEIHAFYLFKRVGADLGIPQKCMLTRTVLKQENNKIVLSGHDMPINFELPKGVTPLTDSSSEMTVTWTNPHEIEMTYIFSATLHERLPVYMENTMGLLTKKMFHRMKTFIEKME